MKWIKHMIKYWKWALAHDVGMRIKAYKNVYGVKPHSDTIKAWKEESRKNAGL